MEAFIHVVVVLLALFNTSTSLLQPWGRTARGTHFNRQRTLRMQESNKDDSIEEDWRSFRARLVLNETPSNTNDQSWAYDSGLFVEKGSIVVSRVESSLGCHDLRQPYFCKCVILIVEHDPEFTQGIILNRPSNLYLANEDIVYLDDEGLPLLDECSTLNAAERENSETCKSPSWRMFFGGDLAGIYDEDPLIVCLHNLTSEVAQSVSDEIVPGIYLTSQLAARGLVLEEGETPESFFTFYGFCGWEKGQLEKEIKRGSWYIVSASKQTIWNELECLRDPENEPRRVGLAMWKGIFEKIGRSHETGQKDSFAELMLKEWATEMLMVAKDDDDDTMFIDDTDIFRALNVEEKDSTGLLLRASTAEVSPFLLHQQFLHKSILLVLQDTESFSIGLILNLPTTETYKIDLSDGKSAEFTVRYGGPDGDKESSLVWLHNKGELSRNRIGKAVGTEGHTTVHSCTLEQVIGCLSLGLASPEDFMLVRGFCVWEKEEGSGGVLGQLRAGNFERVSDEDAQKDMWSLLLTQQRLQDEKALASNLEIGSTAWKKGQTPSPSIQDDVRCVFDTSIRVTDVAHDALEAWLKIYLLGNAEYYR